jgi:hypothetical protein
MIGIFCTHLDRASQVLEAIVQAWENICLERRSLGGRDRMEGEGVLLCLTRCRVMRWRRLRVRHHKLSLLTHPIASLRHTLFHKPTLLALVTLCYGVIFSLTTYHMPGLLLGDVPEFEP